MLHRIKLLPIRIIDNAGRKKNKAFSYRIYRHFTQQCIIDPFVVGLVKECVANSQTYFFENFHISPIWNKITNIFFSLAILMSDMSWFVAIPKTWFSKLWHMLQLATLRKKITNVYFTCFFIRYWQILPCTALLRSPVSSHKNWRQNWHVKFGQQVSQRREIPQWAHTGHKSLIKSLNDICKGMLDRDYYHFILPTAQLFW